MDASRISWTWIGTAALALVSSIADASGSMAIPRNNIVGIRPVAMGQAFTAVADDQNALYYNPAGLARIEGFSMELFSPFVGTNSHVLDSSTKIQDKVQNLGGTSTTANIEAAKDLISTVQGKNHWIRYGANPYFVLPNFGFALLLNGELDAVVSQPLPELMDLRMDMDTDVRIGYGRHLLGPKLAVGGSLGYRHRVALDASVSTEFIDELLEGQDRLQQEFKELLRAGNGFGVDVGMLFTPTPFMRPTFGLAIINLGGLGFSESTILDDFPANPPPAIPQEVRTGFSIRPEFGPFYLLGSVEVRRQNLPYPASEKISFGGEAGWGNHVRFQLGLLDGFLSGGFETRLWILNLRIATYGSEAGLYPGHKPERRYLIGMKLLL